MGEGRGPTGILRRSGRRRLTDALLAALAPVVACGVVLGGLAVWVGSGNAGRPARVEVVGAGRVLLPYGDTRDTAAFFRISNPGDVDDRLVGVTSASGAGGDVELSRHRSAGGGAAYRETVVSAVVPARETLTMSPHGLAVTLRAGEGWRAGDRVPFTLDFRRSGRIEVVAVVVRPGEGSL
jgi:copper(I)-binding protein